MARKQIINGFSGGVMADIAPEVIPQNAMLAGHNVRITGDDDNQYILQKDDGSSELLYGYPDNLKPLAAKEYNDVVYIVGYNSDDDYVEYGSIPSSGDDSVDLYATIPGYTPDKTTITHYDSVDVRFDRSSFELSGDPELSKTFTVTNYNNNLDVKIQLRANFTAAGFSGEVWLNAGSSKTYTLSVGDDTSISSNSKIQIEVLNIRRNSTVLEIPEFLADTMDVTKSGQDDSNIFYFTSVDHVGSYLSNNSRRVATEIDSEYIYSNVAMLNRTFYVTFYSASGTNLGRVSQTLYTIGWFDNSLSLESPINGDFDTVNVRLTTTGLVGSNATLFLTVDYVPGYVKYVHISSSTTTPVVKIDYNTTTPPNLLTQSSLVGIDLYNFNMGSYPFEEGRYLKIDIANSGSPARGVDAEFVLPVSVGFVGSTPFDRISPCTLEGLGSITSFDTLLLTYNDDRYPPGNITVIDFTEVADDADLKTVYGPFLNYSTDSNAESLSTREFNEPFRTSTFGYTENSTVTLELQPTYDGSVNVITASEGTPPRIVNSRQRIDVDKNTIDFIYRTGNNLENVYSDVTIDKTRLIPYVGDMVVDLDFKGVRSSSGVLLPGGYRYFFRLITSDGVESETVEESRLVSVHNGLEVGSSSSSLDDIPTNKSVGFQLSNITNKSYRFCSVYFTRSSGETTTPGITVYKIDKPYEIDLSTGKCDILHTGLEAATVVESSEIQLSYAPIVSVGAVNQKNGRLLLGNAKITNTYNNILASAALSCYVASTDYVNKTIKQRNEDTSMTTTDTYANPDNIYNYLGYLPGETYELGINYVFSNGAVSPTYPIQGLDFTRGEDYDTGLFGSYYSEFVSDTGQNSRGVVRTVDVQLNDALSSTSKGHNEIKSHTMRIDVSALHGTFESDLENEGVTSFFISRKSRIPDMLMEGLLGIAATVSTNTSTAKESSMMSLGPYLGLGTKSIGVENNFNLVPAFGNAMPFSAEAMARKDISVDTVLYAPIPLPEDNKYFAFISPDIASDNAKAAALFRNKTDASISLDPKMVMKQYITHDTENKIASWNPQEIGRAAYGVLDFDQLDEGYVLDNIVLNFVPDGLRSIASKTFTSRSDRQLGLYLYKPIYAKGETIDDTIVASHAEDNGTPLFKQGQYSKASNVLSGLGNKYHATYDMDGIDFVSEEDWDNELPGRGDRYYSQVLMSNVTYSPYIGVKVNSTSVAQAITELINMPRNSTTTTNYNFYTSLITSKSGTGSVIDVDQKPDTDSILGMMGRIYSNKTGTKLSNSDWASVYSTGAPESYLPISKRIRLGGSSRINLTGGDAYVGFYYHKAWRSGGIDGIPTATDAIAYSDDRSGTGITSSGYAIHIPARSSINFALRASIQTEEDLLLNRPPRTYLSNDNIGEVRGSRQADSSKINYGNVLESTIAPRAAYDETIPYNEVDQRNRVYVSGPNITSTFKNGYRDFRGFNFRDYDENLGSISAIVSHGVYTYIVYKSGVSIVEVLERSAIQSQVGNNVYIANADVLPEKSTNIMSFIGTQHPKSVISSEVGVFGVDADRKKIWMISGNRHEIISDSKIQSIINPLFGPNLKNIYSSYDPETTEITFVFEDLASEFTSLVYSARNKSWNGTTDNHKLYQFLLKDFNASFKRKEGAYRIFYPIKETKVHTDYYDGSGEIVRDPHTTYFEFAIKDDSQALMMLNNFVVNGTGVPDNIEVIFDESRDISIQSNTDSKIPCHSNIFIIDGGLNTHTYIDEWTIETAGKMDYQVGDLVTIQQGSNKHHSIVAAVNGSRITLYKEIPDTVTSVDYLFKGWKVPIRLSLMEKHEDRLSISVPSKMLADQISGTPIDRETAVINRYDKLPSGRIIKVRFVYKGIDPVYINSIISMVNLTYS